MITPSWEGVQEVREPRLPACQCGADYDDHTANYGAEIGCRRTGCRQYRAAPQAQDRADFLSERLTGIGGSDSASLFNLGYGCRRRLWYEKRGTTPDSEFEVTGPIELGQYLEPFIARKYEQKTGRQVESRGLLRHPDVAELIVHVDRIIRSEHRPDLGVLEIKAVGRGVYAKIKREGMPEDYVLQLQHGMLVTGLQWGSFAVLNRDNGELLWWDVKREEDACQMILEEAPLFWAEVENGPSPDTLDPEDSRCGSCQFARQCQGAALIQLAETQGDKIEHDETLRPLLAEYDERKAIVEEAEALLDETKEVIRERMGARGAVRCNGRPIYYRAQTTRRWDDPALVEAWSRAAGKVDYDGRFIPAGGAETKFKKASESRPLRIY